MKTYHTPVMVQEVLDGLSVRKGTRYIDATLGGGGHTVEIVRRGGIVLGVDADSDAIAFTRSRLLTEFPDSQEGRDWILVKGNFRNLQAIAQAHGFGEVSGVLMDLGVSSYQLDTASKGFSYRFADGGLDMRFDQDSGQTAREYVNSASREELYEVFTKFGEEERAGTIVDAIVRARSVKEIATVGDMVKAVKDAVGDNQGTSSVLSRIFQALRMYTNDEMHALPEGLEGAYQILMPEGRLAVISFHSLEDRIVKRYLLGDRWHLITKKPMIAAEEEIAGNKRSRSAKLRIAEKI